MKPFVFFFWTFNSLGKSLLERRWPYFCLPFARPGELVDLSALPDGDPENHPDLQRLLHQCAQKAFHGLSLSIEEIEFVTEFDDLEFEGRPVIARVFKVTGLKLFEPIPRTWDASYDFDRQTLDSDIFLKLVEADRPQKKASGQESPCAA